VRRERRKERCAHGTSEREQKTRHNARKIISIKIGGDDVGFGELVLDEKRFDTTHARSRSEFIRRIVSDRVKSRDKRRKNGGRARRMAATATYHYGGSGSGDTEENGRQM
jgi:hypothetical protein